MTVPCGNAGSLEGRVDKGGVSAKVAADSGERPALLVEPDDFGCLVFCERLFPESDTLVTQDPEDSSFAEAVLGHENSAR